MITVTIILGVISLFDWINENDKHRDVQFLQVAILWFILAALISIAQGLGS